MTPPPLVLGRVLDVTGWAQRVPGNRGLWVVNTSLPLRAGDAIAVGGKARLVRVTRELGPNVYEVQT